MKLQIMMVKPQRKEGMSVKFRIAVSEEKYEALRDYLTAHGVELGEDGEFLVTEENRYIAVTRTTVVRRIGNIEGHNRIITGATGMLKASIPFRLSFDFGDLTIDTSDWEAGDYGRFLIDQIIPPLAAETAKQLK